MNGMKELNRKIGVIGVWVFSLFLMMAIYGKAYQEGVTTAKGGLNLTGFALILAVVAFIRHSAEYIYYISSDTMTRALLFILGILFLILALGG